MFENPTPLQEQFKHKMIAAGSRQPAFLNKTLGCGKQDPFHHYRLKSRGCITRLSNLHEIGLKGFWVLLITIGFWCTETVTTITKQANKNNGAGTCFKDLTLRAAQIIFAIYTERCIQWMTKMLNLQDYNPSTVLQSGTTEKTTL